MVGSSHPSEIEKKKAFHGVKMLEVVNHGMDIGTKRIVKLPVLFMI